MKLPPSLKEKRHYIVTQGDEKEIKKILMSYLGIFNYAKAGPKIIKSERNIIISINREFVDSAKTALALSGLRCTRVSGTLNKTGERFKKQKTY